jgi:hypothetical protein
MIKDFVLIDHSRTPQKLIIYQNDYWKAMLFLNHRANVFSRKKASGKTEGLFMANLSIA